jgi:hypothetical protein
MLFNMVLGCFFSMMLSMQMMTMRHMGVMCRLLMVTSAVMLGRFPVMSGRMFVMLCRLRMMFRALFAHRGFLGVRVRIKNRKELPNL